MKVWPQNDANNGRRDFAAISGRCRAGERRGGRVSRTTINDETLALSRETFRLVTLRTWTVSFSSERPQLSNALPRALRNSSPPFDKSFRNRNPAPAHRKRRVPTWILMGSTARGYGTVRQKRNRLGCETPMTMPSLRITIMTPLCNHRGWVPGHYVEPVGGTWRPRCGLLNREFL